MQGYSVERQRATDIAFTGSRFGAACRIDLLLDFGGETLKQAVRRLVDNYTPTASPAPLRDHNPRSK